MARKKATTRRKRTYKWAPPRIGSKARKKMPLSAFLMPSKRKYPYKRKVGGKWVVSKIGLQAALRRARQHGAVTVARKAKRKLKKFQKPKD